MKTGTRIGKVAFALSILLALTGLAQAQWLNNNEVAFTGTVSSVVVNGKNVGTLFVRIETAELRVLVNSKTLLKDAADDEITLDRLVELKQSNQELLVQVIGKFSSGGILGTLARVVETLDSDTFKIRGRITEVEASEINMLLSLLGMKVVVTPDTAILIDGVPAPSTDLNVGMLIGVEGDITAEGSWTAETIRILTENKRRGSLVFEGKVVQIDSAAGRLDIAVTGMNPMSGNVALVYTTPGTHIIGELTVGVHAQVSGVFNPDLSVKAKQILVLSDLEIIPDERKLEVEEVASFTLKLREVAASDLTVSLGVDIAGVITFSNETVTIPKDSQTTDFTVKGVAGGTAVITATAGTATATANIKVVGLPDGEPEPPAKHAQIAFAPDHIKLRAGENREVVLLIKPPQKEEVEVVFEVVSEITDLFEVWESRMLSNGAASLKVMIQAGAEPGVGSLFAALPALLGGGKAELNVEVIKANGKK